MKQKAEMDIKDQITGNIGLASDFLNAVIDDPTLLDRVPEGATVVNIPLDNPELGQTNLDLAHALTRSGRKLVVVTHEDSGVFVQSAEGVRRLRLARG
jgi:Family of unknown function (DUF5647)